MRQVKQNTVTRFVIMTVILAVSGIISLAFGKITLEFLWFALCLLGMATAFSAEEYYHVRKSLKRVRDA